MIVLRSDFQLLTSRLGKTISKYSTLKFIGLKGISFMFVLVKG